MRSKVLVVACVAALLAVVLGLAGCGSSSGGTSSGSPSPAASPSASAAATQTVVAPPGTIPPTVHMRQGDKFKVVLHGNPTTGYSWQPVGMDSITTFKQVGKAVQTTPKSGLIGAPSETIFTFQALKVGTDQLIFWYSPPGDPTKADASYALIVDVAKGHVPEMLTAGEEYTAETAQMRTGDVLTVTINHAAAGGTHAWKVQSSSGLVNLAGMRYSSAGQGTLTGTFNATGSGTGTLVMVNQPSGQPPYQTYSLPLSIVQPKAPITLQVNGHDANETFPLKVGDSLQITLNSRPSAGYAWSMQKPDPNVLKLVGKGQINSGLPGEVGKTMWTYKAVGTGSATVQAVYLGPQAGSTGPDKYFTVSVRVKPGFTPKTVGAVDAYPAATAYLKQNDHLQVELSAKAGTWQAQSKSSRVKLSSMRTAGGKTFITYKAVNPGYSTQVLVARTTGGWPSQAYAFSAYVAKSNQLKTVIAVERKVSKSIVLQKGQTLDVVLPGTPSSGYAWVTDNMATPGILQEIGQPTVKDIAGAGGAAMGDPGTWTMHYKAVGSGTLPLTCLYQSPGTVSQPDGIWMAMVTVQ